MFIEDSEKITKLVCPSSVSAKDKNIINFLIKIALHNFSFNTELFSKLATPVTKPGVVQFSLYAELFSKLATPVTKPGVVQFSLYTEQFSKLETTVTNQNQGSYSFEFK